ncbi:ABC transporter permease [Alicyclobacillus tolerans]|uniref:ABC transporter permease n=1 Tax=Alicyclobacillus tolerans TaxID=90970 RepID=UPI001F47D7CB|nr:ABC transporter permease [Alicyclobacillus tolerans]MCF8566708.1 ABC transporter permease [Alicyclobacillus tolerans]
MRRKFPNELGITIVLIVIGAILSLLSDRFFTTSNIFTLLLNTVNIGLLAIGESFVLLTGGIDLSVGAILALSGVMTALVYQAHLPWYVASLAGIVSGLLTGLFNGVVIRYTRVPPFIATFASMGVASSIPLIITQANPIPIINKAFGFVGQGFVFSVIPFPVIIFVLVAIVAHIVLSRTVFGTYVYAFGGNRESSRLSGINTPRVEILVYVISGTLAGLSGVILASRLASGYPTAGAGNSLFEAISAAVVGGVSLFGGIGSIPGAFVGALIIGTLSDGMNILNVNSYWQPLVIGLVILIAVTIDTIRSSRSGKLKSRLRVSRKATVGETGSPADGSAKQQTNGRT